MTRRHPHEECAAGPRRRALLAIVLAMLTIPTAARAQALPAPHDPNVAAAAALFGLIARHPGHPLATEALDPYWTSAR